MKTVCDKMLCCGCTACESVCPKACIEMRPDVKGFLFPHIDETACIDCGRCEKACPANSDVQEASGQRFFAVKNTDDVRMKSTSGGAFPLLADFVINNGGAVFGAMLDENMTVCHSAAFTTEQCEAFKGSKYVQSRLDGSLKKVKDILINDKWVLFTGTPCQIAGLNGFLGKPYEKLITCDLICHGTPSPLVFKKYIEWIQQRHGRKIVRYNFRDKQFKSKGYGVTAVFDDGTEIKGTPELQSFSSLFSANVMLRTSCHTCPYASLMRPGDFTIGDYWGCEKHHPDYLDGKGISLVIANNDKATALWEKLSENIFLKEITKEESMQNMLKRPSSKSAASTGFWIDFQTKGYGAAAKKYGSLKLSKKIKKVVKKALGK